MDEVFGCSKRHRSTPARAREAETISLAFPRAHPARFLRYAAAQHRLAAYGLEGGRLRLTCASTSAVATHLPKSLRHAISDVKLEFFSHELNGGHRGKSLQRLRWKSTHREHAIDASG